MDDNILSKVYQRNYEPVYGSSGNNEELFK